MSFPSPFFVRIIKAFCYLVMCPRFREQLFKRIEKHQAAIYAACRAGRPQVGKAREKINGMGRDVCLVVRGEKIDEKKVMRAEEGGLEKSYAHINNGLRDGLWMNEIVRSDKGYVVAVGWDQSLETRI